MITEDLAKFRKTSLDIIRMSKFGQMGRWGNQFFQYSFLKTYAEKYGLKIEIPAWCGNELFGFQDSPLSNRLCRVIEEKAHHKIDDTIFPHLPPRALANHDIRGWMQYHTSYYRPHEARIRGLFGTPNPAAVERMRPAAEKFQQSGTTRVGIHIRRGDYGQNMFYITPIDWYVELLHTMFLSWVKPTIFVATECLEALAELKEKFPHAEYHTVETLGIDLKTEPMSNYVYLPHDRKHPDPRAMDWFPDWYMLQQCDCVVMPNSTFSFSAAMVGNCKQLFRSNPEITAEEAAAKIGVSAPWEAIDPWDSYPLQTVKQADLQHIPGLYLTQNAYWKH